MFEKKKLLALLATAAFVAACGGGSGGGGSGSTGDSGSGGSGGSGGGGGGGTSPDTTLRSHLELGSNQLIFSDALRPRSAFQDTGETGGIFGEPGAGTSDAAAPFGSFGFRINQAAQPTTDPGNDSALGRFAISLTEQDTSAAGGVAESMQLLLTNVRVTTDAARIVSATAEPGAALHVTGRNANNETVNITINNVPGTAIQIVTGLAGATDEVGLVFDIDAALSTATAEQRAELNKLNDISGRFNMDAVLSAANIRDPAGNPLNGSGAAAVSVTVAGQPTVSGEGISGNVWINATHPCETDPTRPGCPS